MMKIIAAVLVFLITAIVGNTSHADSNLCLSEKAKADQSSAELEIWLRCVRIVEFNDKYLNFSGPIHPCDDQAARVEFAPAADSYREEWIECRKKFNAKIEAAVKRERDISDAGAKDEAEMAPYRDNPKISRLVMSAELCKEQAIRSGALAAIAKERKYTRIGGVVSLKRMSDLQDELREADDRIAVQKGRLKDFKTSAIPCSTAQMRGLISCDMEHEKGSLIGSCDSVLMEKMIELLGYEHEYALKQEE